MPFSRTAPVACLLLLLVACGDVHAVVQASPTTRGAPHVLAHPSRSVGSGHARRVDAPVGMPVDRLVLTAVNVQRVYEAAWVIAVAKGEAERSARVVEPKGKSAQGGLGPRVTTSGSLAQVMQCIKDHESGNYTESSHPGSGSGAYQYVPDTWVSWSMRAGYVVTDYKGNQHPRWTLAYEAPPSVQDAVTVFVLTNGGAGNWSPRFGADPCTVGMGG